MHCCRVALKLSTGKKEILISSFYYIYHITVLQSKQMVQPLSRLQEAIGDQLVRGDTGNGRQGCPAERDRQDNLGGGSVS